MITHRMSDKEMLDCGVNHHERPLTDRQRVSLHRRIAHLAALKRKGKTYRACIGCYSGVVSHDQGSDYCTRCIKADRP